LGALSCSHKDRLGGPDFYDQARLADPVQRETAEAVFDTTVNGVRYRIEPVADYRLEGVVVSYHDSDAFIDVYHHDDWRDFINIRDLCVIWGRNVASGVYRQMEFENTTWTCWARWPSQEVGRRFSMHQLSNNHLLAADPGVAAAIMAARPGDQISLRGLLVAYSHSDNQFRRGTSTSRTDTGNGACETVFVRDFQILRRANPGWRALFPVTLSTAAISLAGLLVVAFRAPVRVR
jgi:hypothetical protein